jgi:hypothetical protein
MTPEKARSRCVSVVVPFAAIPLGVRCGRVSAAVRARCPVRRPIDATDAAPEIRGAQWRP